MLEGNMQRWKEDCTAAYRRLQAECEQTVKLDRQRYADLADRKTACDVELENMRKRASELEAENFELKKSLFESPMAAVQSDVRIKTFEVEDLKKKLSAVSASKDYYMGYCQQLLKRLKALGDRSWQDEFRTKLNTFKENISHLQHVVQQQPELFGSVEESVGPSKAANNVAAQRKSEVCLREVFPDEEAERNEETRSPAAAHRGRATRTREWQKIGTRRALLHK
eukprot:GHVS01051449.1.p2 GENE.GHVS01051449.1~~GHVS01051449.1.p2  ORF type:complete len:225 (+),score=51.03 GHVS01051449.1:964-1638(+)